MRALSLALLFVLMSLALSAQELPESSFVVKAGYIKVDLPTSSSSTCLAVFHDGRFHMEQLSQQPVSEPRIFEDSLPDENLKSLSAILENQELKGLKTARTKPIAVARGEMVWAIIPRAETTQEIAAIALEGSGRQFPKPLPADLNPLVDWLQATIKSVNQRRLKPLKKAKPVNCWIGR